MNHAKPIVERAAFIDAMRNVASTVTVVTTDGPAGRAGLTLSAMCSLSADPPSVLVCIHRLSHVLQAIRVNKSFCVNLLGPEHLHIADVFAGRVAELRDDRFACATWTTGSSGAPVLAHGVAALDCELAEFKPFASHEIVIGRVLDVYNHQRAPLLYMDRSYHSIGTRCDMPEPVA